LLAGAALAGHASANSDPLTDVLPSGGVGVGPVISVERSPYRGAGIQYDFIPVYVYESEHLYLHSYSAGLKFGPGTSQPRFDVFIRRRFEGTPYHRTPDSLSGMAKRELGVDAGASAEMSSDWGIGFAEYLQDASDTSHGRELRLGYKYPIHRGAWWLRPYVTLAWRNGALNDYYYGVRPEEATATRPAYSAGAGFAPEIGVYAAYSLGDRWSLVGGYSLKRFPASIGDSPIVENRLQWQTLLGVAYNLTPERKDWAETGPLIVRAYYGASSDCNVGDVIELRCASIHTKDKTGIAGFELGRPLLERLYGWPLDIAGFVGVQRHLEDGNQPDSWSFRAYFKPYYYGFPWDSHVRTRIGLGLGLSWAQRIPFSEQRDLSERGRNQSKLLETFDPTVDISLGDLIGSKSQRETFVGLGVSHRSGIFGSSQLLGNVNGGSNYFYVYLETKL
jgi:MipA family protein